MGVTLNLSQPYNLDIPGRLDQQTLNKLDPVQLERARYLASVGQASVPVGYKTAQNYVESTLKPELSKQLFSRQLQFQKEATNNQQILGQESIALGEEELKTRQAIFKMQQISNAVKLAITAAAGAYMGFSMNAAAAGTSGMDAATSFAAMSGQEAAKASFFSTPWGGAVLGGISPTAFGLYYASHMYNK